MYGLIYVAAAMLFLAVAYRVYLNKLAKTKALLMYKGSVILPPAPADNRGHHYGL